ncbi:hypothetical protein BDQ12DRAFT_721536 [Crucibulum laeve]|uniref:Uncharacterized protein n=1 Tax=Crucibulum laeve TaxID=68775 RepID=A0A5C3MFV5_9AGAR|nr:hypothetical protein BDQ12DRAFT_721536 [Crucibulum laeve]
MPPHCSLCRKRVRRSQRRRRPKTTGQARTNNGAMTSHHLLDSAELQVDEYIAGTLQSTRYLLQYLLHFAAPNILRRQTPSHLPALFFRINAPSPLLLRYSCIESTFLMILPDDLPTRLPPTSRPFFGIHVNIFSEHPLPRAMSNQSLHKYTRASVYHSTSFPGRTYPSFHPKDPVPTRQLTVTLSKIQASPSPNSTTSPPSLACGLFHLRNYYLLPSFGRPVAIFILLRSPTSNWRITTCVTNHSSLVTSLPFHPSPYPPRLSIPIWTSADCGA